MKTNPTCEEINEGTSSATMKSDGSKWVWWVKDDGHTICCKWISGNVPKQSPCRMNLDEFLDLYDDLDDIYDFCAIAAATEAASLAKAHEQKETQRRIPVTVVNNPLALDVGEPLISNSAGRMLWMESGEEEEESGN